MITVGEVVHNTENVGFLLNQRVSNIDYRQITEIYNLKHTLPRCAVYCGGPVMTERCTVLHSADYRNDNTQIVNSRCAVTFNDRIIQDICKGQGPRHWKVMLGMCQWTPGQLDAELMRPGGWMQQKWDTQYCWGSYKDKTKMWRRLLEKQGTRDAKQFLQDVLPR